VNARIYGCREFVIRIFSR